MFCLLQSSSKNTHLKKIAQKLENWNLKFFQKITYLSDITLKLSHFHLDDVLFIAILIQKHTFKKKIAQKFEIWFFELLKIF